MELKSMKVDPKEIEACRPCDVMYSGKGQEYPYGLQLFLEEASLAKLGITALPDIEAELTLTAKVKVTRRTECKENGEEGVERSLNLQITDMALGGASK